MMWHAWVLIVWHLYGAHQCTCYKGYHSFSQVVKFFHIEQFVFDGVETQTSDFLWGDVSLPRTEVKENFLPGFCFILLFGELGFVILCSPY